MTGLNALTEKAARERINVARKAIVAAGYSIPDTSMDAYHAARAGLLEAGATDATLAHIAADKATYGETA